MRVCSIWVEHKHIFSCMKRCMEGSRKRKCLISSMLWSQCVFLRFIYWNLMSSMMVLWCVTFEWWNLNKWDQWLYQKKPPMTSNRWRLSEKLKVCNVEESFPRIWPYWYSYLWLQFSELWKIIFWVYNILLQ